MKKITFLAILIFLITACSSSRKPLENSGKSYTDLEQKTGESCVKGRVIDYESKEPISGASISVGTVNTISDFDGNFELCVKLEGKAFITADYVGYNTKRYEIELKMNKILNLGDSLIMGPIQIEVLKPIVYLYPEDTTAVSVEVEFNGSLKNCYPEYNDGWNVVVAPDGTIKDSSGRSYYGLYWEGDMKNIFSLPNGNVVAKENTIAFLEKSLEKLGLNEREANEFIVFWLPILNKSPYNLIHFSTDFYNEAIPLNITPKPDQLIRVMMVYQPLKEPISIEKQEIQTNPVSRQGFTAVEWGGTEFPVIEP